MTTIEELLTTLEVAPKPKPLPAVIPMWEVGNGDSNGIYADQDNY